MLGDTVRPSVANPGTSVSEPTIATTATEAT